MVLKSYFDGGNQADSRIYDVLSFAVASGTINEWNPFERDWREMLARHHAKYLHTTDAVSRVNDFKGWSSDEVDSFLRDCTRIIERHFIRINTEYSPGRFGIYCFVISIDLKHFVARARSSPHAVQDANQACVRQAVGDMLLWATKEAACKSIECFFDQGEPFYGYLDHMLTSKRAKRDAPYLKMVAGHTQADSRCEPASQLADLFAWVQSHKEDAWSPDWKKRILRLPFKREWRDISNLHDVNQRHQATWNEWNIPRRAATK